MVGELQIQYLRSLKNDKCMQGIALILIPLIIWIW